MQCWGDVPAFRGGGDNGPYGIRHLGSFVRIRKESVNTSGEIESSRLGMLRLSASGTIHYCSGLGSFVDKLPTLYIRIVRDARQRLSTCRDMGPCYAY